MIERLLRWLARCSVRRPWAVILLTTLPCALLSLNVLRTPLDLSFTGIIPRQDPEIARYLELSAQLNVAGRVQILLEGPEDALDAAAADCAALAALPGVRSVITGPPVDWAEDNAPWLVDRALFDAWVGLANPARWSEVSALEEEIEALRASLAPPEGARLVEVQLDRDPLDFAVGENPIRALEEETRAILAPHGVTGALTGAPVVSKQDQERTLQRAQTLTPVSLLLVLLVLRRAERRPARLLAIAAPMALAMGATLGLVGALTGALTVLETFFGVMVFGLGVDFGLHLTTRMTEERAAGRPFPEALEVTLRGTGRGVIAGGLTTAGAFFIVGLAPDPMALHLGLSGGLGLSICLALMLTLLPAIWALIERRDARMGRAVDAPPDRTPPRWIVALASSSVAHPRRTLALGALGIAILASGASAYRFESDLSRIFNREVPALDTGRRVQAIFDVNPGPWALPVADLEAARAATAVLNEDPLFIRGWSAADLLPADLEARAELLAAEAGRIRRTRANLQQMSLFAPREQALQIRAAILALERLAAAGAAGPSGLDSLPEALRAQLVLADGRPVVYAYPDSTELDGYVARAQRRAVQALSPDASGFGALIEALVLGDRPWLPWVFGGILVFVGGVLTADLRDARWIGIAMVPVLAGTIGGFGVLCVILDGVNIMTLISAPLILGLGVDDGIHVVHRIREESGGGRLDPANAAARVGQAIALTTATTCVSYATLLFTDHPGMESLAWVLLVGLPICLAASVTLLPALAELRGRGPSAR